MEEQHSVHLIIQQLPLATILIDREGKIIDFNEKAYHFFLENGMDQTKSLFSFFSEQARNTINQGLKRLISDKLDMLNVQSSLKSMKNRNLKLKISIFNLNDPSVKQQSLFLMTIDEKKYFSEFQDAMKSFDDINYALNVSSIVAITNIKGNILYANDKFYEISKYSKEELIGKNHRILNSGYHPKSFFVEMWSAISKGNVWRGEIRNKTKDGEYYWVDTTIVPFLDENNHPIRYISIRNDITSRKKAEKKIRYLAFHDELTGLANRRYFFERLGDLTKTGQGQPFAIFFFDLDRFKIINDSYGHAIGDLLLIEAAKRIKSCLNEGDVLARQGGDEFAVISRLTNAADYYQLTEKIIHKIKSPFMINGQHFLTSVSIGISRYPHDGISSDELIRKADIAMYEVKEHGGNNAQFFNQELNHRIIRKIEIEKRLRKAIKNDELTIVYQPKVHVLEKAVIGMEALLRWFDQGLGPISPAEFIPIAEETGLIIELDHYVIEKVCCQMKEWESKNKLSLIVSINLSVAHFQQRDFLSSVREIIRKTGVDSSFIEFEITENISLNDIHYVSETIQELKRMGVQVSIDDFGTGYSSLGYLKKFEVDTLKIDKSFIQRSVYPEEASIVRAIVTIANVLKINVIAEGVETIEQLNFLKEIHCYEIQGFIFSKPLTPEEFEIDILNHQSIFYEKLKEKL